MKIFFIYVTFNSIREAKKLSKLLVKKKMAACTNIIPSIYSTYIWKKGKQFVAIVQTIPVQGRDKNKTIHPINISSETIARSFSKLNYTISVKKRGGKKRKFS